MHQHHPGQEQEEAEGCHYIHPLEADGAVQNYTPVL